MSRARITLPAPPTFSAFPGWARSRTQPAGAADAGLLAGAALAAIHPIARDEHPLGGLWRQRLALANAAVLARQAGRREDQAGLRDAWYFTRQGDDPGPGGRILRAWRRLGERAALRPEHWLLWLAAAFELTLDEALEDVVATATKLTKGEGSAVAAAAEIAAISLRFRPDSEFLALWLADAVLAIRLKWPAPVPLIATEIEGSALKTAVRHVDGDSPWLTAVSLAYARAAAAASDLYAELARRANRLLAAGPKLRGKDAARMLAILLVEDAQPATAGTEASDRSTRRLFERLVSLGAARELTGRSTFRLYGL
jgi:hypothetical protein